MSKKANCKQCGNTHCSLYFYNGNINGECPDLKHRLLTRLRGIYRQCWSCSSNNDCTIKKEVFGKGCFFHCFVTWDANLNNKFIKLSSRGREYIFMNQEKFNNKI